MSTLSVDTSFNIQLQFESAAFHTRIIAWLLDFVIIIFCQYAANTALEYFFGSAALYAGLDYLLYLPFFLYHLMFEIFNHGQSLGKMILGIRVVSNDGREESNTQAMVRWLMRTIDFGGLLGLLILLAYEVYFMGTILILSNILACIVFLTSKYHQRLGDIAAGTVVVYKKLPYDLSDTIFREIEVKNYEPRFPMVMRLSDNDMNIIDNVLKRHHNMPNSEYVRSVAEKVKHVLQIETTLENVAFLETLLDDYNYLSRK